MTLPWHPHVVATAVLVAIGVLMWRMGLTRRRRVEVTAALLSTAAVMVWPMGDLARHVSLSAAVVQRLVLMLVFVPVLLAALPVSVLERWSRPSAIDWFTRRFSHPGVAMVSVTVLGTLTVIPAAISLGARSWIGHGLVLTATVLAGVILWIPGLGCVPGSRRLSPAARAGYLFASSLVVTVLSFVWIFSTKPLYPALHGQEAILGVSALFDQQLAGFIAKLGAYLPLWMISFYVFFHAEDQGVPVEESPLHWADVERELLRVDRRRRREMHRRRGPSVGDEAEDR